MGELVRLSAETDLSTIGPRTLITTMPQESDDDKRQLARAMMGADYRLSELIGEEIKVTHVLIHHTRLPNLETGEIEDGMRAVLIDGDGTRYSTSSPTIVKTLLIPHQLFGFELPYQPEQSFVVRQEKSRNGARKYLVLEWRGP